MTRWNAQSIENTQCYEIHDHINPLSQWFPNCAPQIPRYPRPVPGDP